MNCQSDLNREEKVTFQKPTLQYQTFFLLQFLQLDLPEPNSINSIILFEKIQEPALTKFQNAARPNLSSICTFNLTHLGSNHNLTTEQKN